MAAPSSTKYKYYSFDTSTSQVCRLCICARATSTSINTANPTNNILLYPVKNKIYYVRSLDGGSGEGVITKHDTGNKEK